MFVVAHTKKAWLHFDEATRRNTFHSKSISFFVSFLLVHIYFQCVKIKKQTRPINWISVKCHFVESAQLEVCVELIVKKAIKSIFVSDLS